MSRHHRLHLWTSHWRGDHHWLWFIDFDGHHICQRSQHQRNRCRCRLVRALLRCGRLVPFVSIGCGFICVRGVVPPSLVVQVSEEPRIPRVTLLTSGLSTPVRSATSAAASTTGGAMPTAAFGYPAVVAGLLGAVAVLA